MRYKIQGEWLNLPIDEDFPFSDVAALLDFYHISAKQRLTLIASEAIMLNHQPCQLHTPLVQGMNLRIKAFKKEAVDYKPDACFNLEVIYEDLFCLVVNKPSGYIIHGENKNDLGTLANVVANYYIQHNIRTPVRYLHRLDKDTSGLVMFCKSSFFQPYYDYLLAKKEISRQYQALVDGIVPWTTYTLEAPIGKNRHKNNCYGVYPNGKYAKTTFKKLKTFDHQTLLSCTLHTGRTHQIRVHLAHLGYPITNDNIYGQVTSHHGMQLKAVKLEWLHPITQEKMSCQIKDQLSPIE